MPKIVVRSLVASDLWEILCPRIESNVGFAENGKRFFCSFNFTSYLLFLKVCQWPIVAEYCPMSGNNSGWKKSLESIWYKLLKAGSVIFKTLQEQRMQPFGAETAILTEKIFSTVENILKLVVRPHSGKIKHIWESFCAFPITFSLLLFLLSLPLSSRPIWGKCTGETNISQYQATYGLVHRFLQAKGLTVYAFFDWNE